MKRHRRLVLLLGAVAIGVTGALVAVAPASAATTCPYPYVCFLDNYPNENGNITGKFQVVTSDFQPISGTSMRSAYIKNTRHDDVAYVRFNDGKVICIPPEKGYGTDNDLDKRSVNGVKISWSPTC